MYIQSVPLRKAPRELIPRGDLCGSLIPSYQSFVSAEQTCSFISHEIKSWRTTSDKHKLKSFTCLTPQSAFHLSMWAWPQTKTKVLNPPMNSGDNLFGKNLPFPCVRKGKTQPFTTHQVHLSVIFQNANLPNYWQIHRHTWKRLSDCGILLQKTNPI